MGYKQSQKLLETAFKMLKILKKAIEEKTRLPIFRPGNSGFEIVEIHPAKDIEQSLHSIGVWLYHNVVGDSEWKDPAGFVAFETKTYEALEDHDLAEIVNPLIVEFHGLGVEEVENILQKMQLKLEEKIKKQEAEEKRKKAKKGVAKRSKAKLRANRKEFKPAKIKGFQIPTRSKRELRFEKTEENNGSVVDANQNFLMPEVGLTLPHEAVQNLVEMFPELNVDNWEQALKQSIEPAVRACNQYGIDAQRLIFFPWIKRSALAQIGELRTQHHGALIESVVFPKLEELYKQKDLGFYNSRSGKMSEDKYLSMKPELTEWLEARENEIEGDIGFSAVILDLFQRFSVKAVRWEIENNYPNLIPASCYLTQQLLLTNIQLLSANIHQRWEMPGDLYDYEGSSSFGSALVCDVNGYGFGFVSVHVDYADSLYGSVVFPFGV